MGENNLGLAISDKKIISRNYRRLSEQFSESQAAFGTTLGVTGGYLKAGTSFLKRIAGRIFRISKLFQKSRHKLYYQFSVQKDSQIF
jgi:hypothetical protein